MLNLNTNIKKLNLDTCLMNASGVYCRTKEELEILDKNMFTGAFISKSCTLEAREGNPKPIYWDDKYKFFGLT